MTCSWCANQLEINAASEAWQTNGCEDKLRRSESVKHEGGEGYVNFVREQASVMGCKWPGALTMVWKRAGQ